MKKTIILCILLTSTGFYLKSSYAQQRRTEIADTQNTNNQNPTIKVSAEKLKKWKQTIEFGVSKQRINVINQIKRHNDKKTFNLLIQILKNDTSTKVKKAAVMAARILNYKEAAPYILKQLKEDDNDLRQTSLYALGFLKYKKAGKKIIQFLDADNTTIKVAAITAAGELKLKNTLPKLHKLATSMSGVSQIREAAIIAIGKIGSKTSIPILKKIYDNPAYTKFIRMYTVTAMGMIGGNKVFKYLKKAINSNEYFIRLRAVEAIGKINNPEVYKYLKTALRDDNEKIRIQALKSVAKQNNKKRYFRQIKYMIKNEPSYRVKKQAVITFIKMGGNEAINFIKEQLKKPGNEFLKYYIVLGLEKLDKSTSVPILENIYKKNKSEQLRVAVIRSLNKINSSNAINALKDFLFLEETIDDGIARRLKQKILMVLVHKDPSDVKSTFEKIIKKSKDIWVKLHAIRLVGSLADKKGYSIIEDIVKDESVKEKIKLEAIKAAGRLKMTGLKSTIKKLFLKSQNPFATHVMKNALVQMGESGANLDAEKKKFEKEQRENRVREARERAQNRNSNNSNNNNANNRNNDGGVTPSGVPRRFNPNRR